MPNDESKPSYSFSDDGDKGLIIVGEGLGFTPICTHLVVGDNLLTINLETGEVEAPSLEAASEAGRVFVLSVRHYLKEQDVAGFYFSKAQAFGVPSLAMHRLNGTTESKGGYVPEAEVRAALEAVYEAHFPSEAPEGV